MGTCTNQIPASLPWRVETWRLFKRLRHAFNLYSRTCNMADHQPANSNFICQHTTSYLFADQFAPRSLRVHKSLIFVRYETVWVCYDQFCKL